MKNHEDKEYVPTFPPDLFVNLFESLFPNRNKAIRSYWDFYYKSGIMDHFREKMMIKYQIPKSLDPKYDYNYGFVDAKYGAYDEEYSEWLSNNKRKRAFEKDVMEIMRLLYLPNNSSRYITFYFLYGKKYSESYPLYSFVDLILNLRDGVNLDDFTGYTDEELKVIDAFVSLVVPDHDQTLIRKNLKKVRNTIRRPISVIRNVDAHAELVKSLKDYRRTVKEFDEVEQTDQEIKVTSSILADRIIKDYSLRNKDKNANTIRKRIERLTDKFSFLENYILDDSL